VPDESCSTMPAKTERIIFLSLFHLFFIISTILKINYMIENFKNETSQSKLALAERNRLFWTHGHIGI